MGLFTLDKELLPENWSKVPSAGRPILEEPPPLESLSGKEASSGTSSEAEPREPVYLVTDTSWWMEQGWRDAVRIAEKIPEAFFAVPTGVMRELDGLKKAEGEKGKRALEATKRIHELVSMGRCRIVRGNGSVKGVLASPVDEEVLSVAGEWKEKGKTYLLTTDRAQMAMGENERILIHQIVSNECERNRTNKPRFFDKDVFYVMLAFSLFVTFIVSIIYRSIEVFIGGALISLYFSLCGALYPILLVFRSKSATKDYEIDESYHGPGCGCGSCQAIYED